MILLSTGQRPALARKIRYYVDPEFQKLFDPSLVAIPARVANHRPRPARIKAAPSRDPGQTMKNIGAFSIAATEGRESGNSRRVRAGPREAAGA
ncbi:hypothetical protein E9677_17785 [Rhizobium rhizophilum]|uniref:Uncharacterized protein n=1 Tax=Rhizobium rhizophilum TaxID=1850373 RepID=A0ABY2QSG2_9HYPH|nr:hypothetical protein E9677_17785 [Rhizobium rhizophilum]